MASGKLHNLKINLQFIIFFLHSNNEFEMTTTSHTNSFITNGHLYLNPTLTAPTLSSPDSLYDGLVYNLTGCTFNLTTPNGGFIIQPNGDRVFNNDAYLKACSGVSNKTVGVVINPVMSARVSTRFSASIKFGRVEVRAKMPNGCVSTLFPYLPFLCYV